MTTVPARTQRSSTDHQGTVDPAVPRLALYRQMVRMRQFEKRAYDLFMQNLVKGTSHLSLGQEAIAAGFGEAMQPDDYTFATYRGHAHTLARGASMTAVMGELLGRDNGLMHGKGGSMHLTDVEPRRHGLVRHRRRTSDHRAAAPPGRRSTAAPTGRGRVLRRRHDEHRRVPRGAEPCGGLEAAGGLRLREQPLHGVHADLGGDRRGATRPPTAPPRTGWNASSSTATTPTRSTSRPREFLRRARAAAAPRSSRRRPTARRPLARRSRQVQAGSRGRGLGGQSTRSTSTAHGCSTHGVTEATLDGHREQAATATSTRPPTRPRPRRRPARSG